MKYYEYTYFSLPIILVTIVLSILTNRLVRCPLLVGAIFFSITLLVAIILSNITLVILAIILGIVGFLSAFLDCVFNSSCFFRHNDCIRCHNPYNSDDETNNNDDDNSLRIINSNGEVVARISGNTVNCRNNNGCNCRCNRGNENNVLLTDVANENIINTTTTSNNNTSCRVCRRR